MRNLCTRVSQHFFSYFIFYFLVCSIIIIINDGYIEYNENDISVGEQCLNFNGINENVWVHYTLCFLMVGPILKFNKLYNWWEEQGNLMTKKVAYI